MPTSRKRTVHHSQKAGVHRTKRKVKARTTLAILFGAFGILIPLFSGAGDKWVYILLGALAGSIIGYFMGKSLEDKTGK